jgi:hypothetical protein
MENKDSVDIQACLECQDPLDHSDPRETAAIEETSDCRESGQKDLKE